MTSSTPRHVWLVDDDEDLAALFGVIFRDAGYVFESFLDGETFLQQWTERRETNGPTPDVLLVDIRLPGTNGIDLVRRFRQFDSYAAVIVVTAIDSESAVINAFESGADDVIRKPLSVAETLARINGHMGRRSKIAELQRQGGDFRLLMELSHVLSRSTRVPETLRALIDGIRKSIDIENAAVYIADPRTGELHRALPSEPSRSEASPNSQLDLRNLPQVADALAGRKEAYLDPEKTDILISAIGGRWDDPLVERSSAVFPMVLHDEFIGALVVVAKRPKFGWAAREQYIGSIIADFAAVAVHRAGLFDSIRQEHMRVDHASRELQKTRDYFSKVVMSSPDAIVAADISGGVFVMNRAAESILGYNFDEAFGMDVRALYPEGGAERILHNMRESPTGRMERHRGVLIHKNGTEIPVDISAAIIFEAGQEAATVGIFTDIRGQLQMQAELQQAHDSLEESQRKALVAELAGAAAHELNQPLTSLLGYVELLEKRLSDDEESTKVVHSISNESRRVAEIVKKLGQITDYKTKEYVGGTHIIDLDQASEVEEVPAHDESHVSTEPKDFDLLDAIPSAVGLADEHGRLIRLNSKAAEFLGVDPSSAPQLDLKSRLTSQGMKIQGNEFYLSDVAVAGASRTHASLTLLPVEGTDYNRVLFEIPGTGSGSASVRMLEVLANALRHVALLRTSEKILELLARCFRDVFPTFGVVVGIGTDTFFASSNWGNEIRDPATVDSVSGQFTERDHLFWEQTQRGFRTRFESPGNRSWVQIEKLDAEKFTVEERDAFETFAQQTAFALSRGDATALTQMNPIIDHLDAVIAICNTKRQVEVSNETFDALMHGERAEGRDILEFFIGEGREKLRSAISTTLAGASAEPFNATLTSDGETGVLLQIQVHGNRAGDPSTPPLGVIVIGQQSEFSLREIDKRMERAEQLFSLGQLATGVAHELKNPLTSILNYADYLRQKYQGSLFDARDAERLGRIIEGVEQIDTFIKDLVSLARPESGPHERVDLSPVISEAATVCEVYWERHQVSFTAAPITDSVMGNRVHLRQVFVNLFTNAASAMPPEGGHIVVNFEVQAESVRCMVRDTAGGIAPEVKERIFEPFFTTRAGHGGSGLGLAIVHQIVKQHGGQIQVESEPGVGSVFTIVLPRAL